MATVNANKINGMKITELVGAYNELTGKSIKKFASKDKGVEMVVKVIKSNTTKAAELGLIKVKVAGKVTTSSTEQKMYGRKSEFTGKRLYRNMDVNPRRPGTLGHRSFDLIVDGMTYEEYLMAGGRNNDLHWDIERKWVIVK